MSLMHIPDAVAALDRDLRGIFGTRLQSLVVYGLRAHARIRRDQSRTRRTQHSITSRAVTHTLAVVDTLSTDDLRACTARVDAWHDGGLATPLAPRRAGVRPVARRLPVRVRRHPCRPPRSCPAAIRSTDCKVETADLRRACEVQARGHWLHLREGYLETRGRGDALAVLIVESAPAFAALVTSVAHLDRRCRRGRRRRRRPARRAPRLDCLRRRPESSRSPASARFRRPRPSGCSRRTSRRLNAWSSYIDTWKS